MELLEILTNTELAPGRSVLRVPFEIRQSFKDTFATWKWHEDAKLWSVDESEREKLAQWAQIVRAVASASADNTRRHLTAKQIERAEAEAAKALAQLDDMRSKQAELPELKAKLARSLELLQQHRDQLDTLEAAQAVERHERERHQADIDAALGAVIDLPALRKAVDMMTVLEASTNRRDREDWIAAQLHIVIARNTLAEAGLRLEALDFLAESREPIRKMSPGAWYSLARSRA